MGELFNFLGNHVLASIVGAFSVISYGLGIAEQAQAITIRFKAWQLQALGAAFFFFAVAMVLVSYDQERSATPAVVQAISPNGLNAAPPDPTGLPANTAAETAAMLSRRLTPHTT